MPRTKIIEIRNLTKIFYRGEREVHALKNASLDVYEGEFFVLVGPSGCGKTTLLRIISGLLPRTSGTIKLKGAPVTSPQTDIGMVFQTPVLPPWKNVLQNVLFSIDLLKRDLKKYREKAYELLKLVGVDGFEDKYPRELSGGMQQRVSICRVLIYDPSLLIMDEPFGALDALTREEMNTEIQRIWLAKKKTILFVTHNIPEAVFLGDRVAVMGPRPGTILDIKKIDFSRPREMKIKYTRKFAKYVSEIRKTMEQPPKN